MIAFRSFVTLIISLSGIYFASCSTIKETEIAKLEGTIVSTSSGGGLRNFGEETRTNAANCYTCDDIDPCQSITSTGHAFYFPHCDINKFVQCSEHVSEHLPSICYDMPCAPGTQWYQSSLTCCRGSDIECQQPVGNRGSDGTSTNIPIEGLGTGTCSGLGNCGGKKPCFDFQNEIWQPFVSPVKGHESYCESNNDCESCCCGIWIPGVLQVCVDSRNPGQGLPNVCMSD
mmetsp:Transcript_15288/g.44385  ORF Transcript_15288/g.44385 Transcript_15288/m.44385 type:complete len:230 (-) Transcript_15288:202-891(-)